MTIEQMKRQQKLMQKLNGNKQAVEICKRLQALYNGGVSTNEIEAVIKQMNLPLGAHMFIMGNFSDLMGLRYV